MKNVDLSVIHWLSGPIRVRLGVARGGEGVWVIPLSAPSIKS